MKRWQLVFVPCPGMGHLVSTVEFAKLLINHDPRLSIALLVIRGQSDAPVDAYTHSLASSPSFPTRLQLTLLPTNLPTVSESDHFSYYLDAFFQNQKPNVREAVTKLNSGPDPPRLAGFVVDMYCTAIIDVADEFGVPAMVFYTSGAAHLGFLLHFHALRERHNVDTTAFNFKDSGAKFAFPSYVNPVPAKVLPHVVLEKEWESFFFNQARGHRRAKGIIVNTFEELESHAVHSFSNGDIPIYPVGPILNLKGHTDNPTQQGADVIKWLDDQPAASVIFLCFGSMVCFDQDNQVREIACALENSGVRFLWSLRKPPPKGSMKRPCDYSGSELTEVLPEGYLERTAKIGRIIGWAPQAQILAHPAVGGFVSHCGWNSVLESVYYGVPIATWPLTAEQQMNAFELVRELGMGVEISLDYRIEFKNGSKTEVLSAERIEKGIKDVMADDVRKKVKEVSEKSRRALMEGGSSYSYLGRFIHDIMNMT